MTPTAGRLLAAILLLSLTFALTQADAGMMKEGLVGDLNGAPGHTAKGRVSIITDQAGQSTLTLADIKVDKVPDGRLYLARNGDYRLGVEIGLLEQFRGTVSFPIPAHVDPGAFNSLVIWCKKFSVEIGRASLVQMQN